ncbi:MAG TPA: sugar kinase [Candidatus Hydrogenedentes bacterium]|nr:sugar kinase [Candidatus Hydrogenedentota bacterium]HPG68995.1 sugar kinase [Candidatus Hydrogenedentota bacterium]
MKNVVTFGEIMMRLSTPGFQRFVQVRQFDLSFAGGEANVAASLAQFGQSAEFVTALPDNDIGDACLDFLRQYGIGTRHIVRGGQRLGIYFLETGAAQRPSKVVYDRAHSAIATMKPGTVDWDTVFTDADWFHWTGITPAISESAAACCLEAAQCARRLGLTVSCDLNYRAKLWKWGRAASDVMPDLVRLCDVAIGNEEDADKVLGIKAPDADVTSGKVDADAYVYVCEEIARQYPNLNTVAVTLRGSLSASHNTWSGLLYHGGRLFRGPQFDIMPIVDRVGGGDSFMGGLIYGLRHYDDPQRAIDFAVCASCLKHSIPGDFNLVRVPEVEKLMKGDASGRVSR